MEILLLTNSIVARTLYVVSNGRLAPVADIDDSRLAALSNYEFSPKRFLKISKVNGSNSSLVEEECKIIKITLKRLKFNVL